jgi:hypothetical protein
MLRPCRRRVGRFDDPHISPSPKPDPSAEQGCLRNRMLWLPVGWNGVGRYPGSRKGLRPLSGLPSRFMSHMGKSGNTICEACHGTGYLADAKPPQPCPACGGVGFGYCSPGRTRAARCEGYVADTNAAVQGDDLHGREHIASPDCWCGPTPDPVVPDVFIHRDCGR